MKAVIISCVICLALFQTCFGYDFPVTQEEIDSLNDSLEKWRLRAGNQGDLNQTEYIEILGSGLGKTSNDVIFFQDKSKRVIVHELLKKKLISIPGHAEYYRDRISRSRQIVDGYKAAKAEDPAFQSAAGTGINQLVSEQGSGFQILENLPSVETVRVLGEFLSDDRGAEISFDEQINTGETSNDGLAMSAISRLGIANAPTPPIRVAEDMDRKLESWKHWYAEVKAGRRTFRFEGDPVDYDLRGPSKRGAIVPEERVSKRGVKNTQSSGMPDKPEVSTKSTILWLIALGILFLAFSYKLVRRKTKQGRKE